MSDVSGRALAQQLLTTSSSEDASNTSTVLRRLRIAWSSLSATGVLTFAVPPLGLGWVDVKSYGAVVDGVTDDSAAWAAALASGQHVYGPGGTHKINTGVVASTTGQRIRLADDAVLNVANLTGAGRSGVHVSVNVLPAITVTASRVTIEGGRITGAVSSGGLNIVGILVHGATFTRVKEMKLDTLYCGLWAGNAASDVTVRDLEVSTCTRNILLGYMPLTATNPQVSRAMLINVNSHDATGGDGVKCHTYTRDVQILGGHYYSNSNNGIDCYVSGERTTIEGANCYSNSVDGIATKYADDSGEGANQQGFSRRNIIRGNTLRLNGRSGLYALIDAAYPGTATAIDECVIEGNRITENVSHGLQVNLMNSAVRGNIIARNQGRGIMARSCLDSNFSGNVVSDNGTTGSPQSGWVFALGLYAGAANSARLTISGNHLRDTRAGAARSQNRGMEIDAIGSSKFRDNIASNNITSDYLLVTAGSTVLFADNDGVIESGSVAALMDISGTGSPESVVTANIGSRYRRTDGGANTSLYVKESGTAATGWVGK